MLYGQLPNSDGKIASKVGLSVGKKGDGARKLALLQEVRFDVLPGKNSFGRISDLKRSCGGDTWLNRDRVQRNQRAGEGVDLVFDLADDVDHSIWPR